jgi:hypothetical protein
MSGDSEAQNVKVMVRVRPFSTREINLSKKRGERLNCAVRMRGATCVILEHSVDDKGFPVEKEREAFQFDNCFWSIPIEQETEPSANPFATQKDVYMESGKVALDAAFEGFNTCIFAYGQTGSGKTHSMLGVESDPGVSPRLIDDLFQRIEARQRTHPTTKCQVEVMFFEIYNEKVRDLFADKKKQSDYEPPRIRQHPVKGVFVEGLKRNIVSSARQTKDFMESGAAERAMAPTKMNLTSSRSHAVFQLQLTQLDGSKGTQKVATINLVDLAGSEKVKMSEVTGDSFTEAKNINQSLSTLRRVIDTLIENSTTKKQKPPPFRESVLTYLLSDSLGGNSKTMMISAISPHESNIEDTLGTLRYALRAKAIVCNAVVNEERNAALMDAMKDELMALRTKLANGEVVGGGGGGMMLPEDIQKEIQEKEAEMARMEEQAHEMEKMVEESRAAKAEAETKLQEAATIVSTQKRERFATAFRNAFMIAQDKKRIEVSTKELDDARRDALVARTELDATREEIREKLRDLAQVEDKLAATEQTLATERVKATDDITTLQRLNRSLTDDKAALQRKIDDMVTKHQQATILRQETEKRLQAMQDDMLALARKTEQVAAEKNAVVEKLEAELRSAAQQLDEMRRRKEKHKNDVVSSTAEAQGFRRATEEANKDRLQLLATVKAQQQLLNERSTIIEQLHAQTQEHGVTAAKAAQRADSKQEEVRILMESLREYEAAAGKWLSEHAQKERELQQLRLYADGPRVSTRLGTGNGFGSPATPPRTYVSESPHAARYSTLTPRRAHSPTASTIRSPLVRQPSVQHHPPASTSPLRARWA